MSELNETPKGSRIHIAFFGLRNAGKSTLVNAFCGQDIAIVSDVAGTTTDPVSKAMEILPLGPCLITDTAGLDDIGELGEMRVKKTLSVLATTDIAVWVDAPGAGDEFARRSAFMAECAARRVTVLEFHRGDSVDELKKRIASLKIAEIQRPLLDGIVKPGDRIILVCPIDESAPKGRLILPQVQMIRECLDLHATCAVCQPSELAAILASGNYDLVITDSQAFGEVRRIMAATSPATPLTSFSILYARQKGDLDEYAKGVAAIASLNDGDTVLIAEGCTHHRQCNDIGTVKLPKALAKLSGKKLNFIFSSGADFPVPPPPQSPNCKLSLIVQCGGCMLNRREVMRRIDLAKSANIPIANYGMVLGAVNGMTLSPGSPFIKFA